MFQRRLVLSFVLIAVFAAVYGAVGWWISHEAARRIVTGRLASDISTTFYLIEDGRLSITTWAAGRVALAAPPDVDEAEFILRAGAALSARLADLRALAAEARRLDDANPARTAVHDARAARLDVIEPAVLDLRRAAAALAFGEVTDRSHLGLEKGGRLELALSDSLLAERVETNRERAAGDQALARLQFLSVASAIGFITACLGLAIHLLHHLSRPLRDLSAGIAALEMGRLNHRVPTARGDEFGRLGAALNRMAQELAHARADEARLRLSLEDQITDRTRELTETVAALEASERIRRQLLADVGHELRSPVTVVRGEAEIALRAGGMTDKDYREVLARIAGATRQMGGLIEDLLILSRDEAEALPLHDGPADPATVLEDALLQSVTLAGMRDVAVVAERPFARGTVRGDALRLRQVMVILLDNALRYSHEGGTVTVTTGAQGGLWRLTIADRGIGIPPEDLAQVFDRGFRGACARRHRADGSGLGLPIARRLARLHGGEVTLAPHPGGGTRADLILPLAVSDGQADATGDRAA